MLSNDYKCIGQMNLDDVLKLMEAPQAEEKSEEDTCIAYKEYGVRKFLIRGQRTWLRYNPNPLYRLGDGPYIIFATIAYVSETVVYLKEFMLYPKLYEFETREKATEFHMKAIEEIQKNVEEYPLVVHKETDVHLELEEMYQVDNEWKAESWVDCHRYMI